MNFNLFAQPDQFINSKGGCAKSSIIADVFCQQMKREFTFTSTEKGKIRGEWLNKGNSVDQHTLKILIHQGLEQGCGGVGFSQGLVNEVLKALELCLSVQNKGSRLNRS